MIETLEIKNFKSYRNSIMSFFSGINAIIGRPNHGKTNIIRALQWLFSNSPLSGDMLSDFIDDNGIAEVKATLTGSPDYISLKKKINVSKDGKSKSVISSSYSLGGREFAGMNKNVPDLIQKEFNITELNIQEQFDQPYLVNSSAGEIAKTINRITKQEMADELKSNLTKKVNSLNREVDTIKLDIKNKEKELKKYDGLDIVEALLSEIKLVSDDIDALITEKEDLDILIRDYELFSDEIKKLENYSSVETIISDIIDLENEIIDSEKLFLKLKKYKDDFEKSKGFEILFKELKNIITEIDEVTISYNAAIDLIDLIDDCKSKFEIFNNILTDSNSIRNDYIVELKKSKQCPVCFSNIDNKVIEKIKEEL